MQFSRTTIWLRLSRCPWWTCGGPWEAPAAALAAAEAAGMPVRRPRRPAAVSAAFEADADDAEPPQLRRPARAGCLAADSAR